MKSSSAAASPRGNEREIIRRTPSRGIAAARNMPPTLEERLNRRRLLEQKKQWPAEPKPRGPSRLPSPSTAYGRGGFGSVGVVAVAGSLAELAPPCGGSCARGSWISAAGPSSPARGSRPISSGRRDGSAPVFRCSKGSRNRARRIPLKSRWDSARRKRRDTAQGFRGGLGSVFVPPEAGTPGGGPALPGRLPAPGGVFALAGLFA